MSVLNHNTQRAFVSLVVAVMMTVTPAQAAKLALVIGNSHYAFSGTLDNPVNDAKAMALALEAIGYRVKLVTDAPKSGFEAALAGFGQSVTAADQVLVFYAGHGIQAAGRNYLIPVDAKLQEERSLRLETIDLDVVMDQVERAAVRVIILDACRNNPFPASSRGGSHGLAVVTAPTGSLIAYSTAPGKTASDGSSGNGLYTAALLKAIDKNAPIESVFKEVRRAVSAESGGQQVPWESSSLIGDLFLTNELPAHTPASASGPTAADPQDDDTIPDATEGGVGAIANIRTKANEHWHAQDYVGARRILEQARTKGTTPAVTLPFLYLWIARIYADEANHQQSPPPFSARAQALNMMAAANRATALNMLIMIGVDHPDSSAAIISHVDIAAMLSRMNKTSEACQELAAYRAALAEVRGSNKGEYHYPKIVERATKLEQRLGCGG